MSRAQQTRLPLRRPPSPLRHGDRGGRGRQRRLHAGLDALLPRGHPADPGPGGCRDLDRLAGRRCRPARCIGALVDRVGAKRVLLVGNALQALGFFAYLVAESFAAVLLWTIVVTRRPDRLLGRLRQHRRRDLAAGGARAVVRLPRRAAQRRLRAGWPGLRRRDRDRHRPGVRHGRGGQRRRRTCSPSGCCSPCRRRRRRSMRRSRALGHGAAGRALPAARRRPGRLLGLDHDPDLRAAGVRRDRARAARLGQRRGVHRQLPDGRLRAGAGGQRA